MRLHLRMALALLLAVIEPVRGTCATWQTQVNYSMCNWQGLRANVIRDTIYIDGGQLWFQQGYSDGCVNYVNDGNLEGSIYSLNLSTPFNTSSDFTSVLTNTSIAGGAANNIAPNYVEGAMFANNDEFYLYGGMLRLTNSTESPADNEVLGYEAYQYGPYRNNWEPGWNEESLSTNVTRYITSGASVSAPSENMGFLFSGMRSPDWGSFSYDGMDSNTTADTLISVDMKVMRSEKWTNSTLPSYITGRANAELIWVPVSESGVLVAIGGVVNPVELWRDIGLDSSQTALSKKISQTFMETVSLYDVDSQEWYIQNTTGDVPPQLTQFCSVIASASDGSSHNIYIYGGYNGLEYDASPSDDVYILSLPSFKWVKAYSGTAVHGRSGHECIKVYPNQMLAIGGLHVDPTNCIEDGIIVNFNLNTLAFQSTYHPAEWGEYKVPDILTAEIGGSSSGGATTTAPSSWTNSSLAAIFEKKYTKTIDTYWPYKVASTTTSTTTESKKSDGFPSWAAAVIGVLSGLLIVGLLVGFWFYRRRRNQPRSASHETKSVDNTEDTKPKHQIGLTSPEPGPPSQSTGMETVPYSTISAATPVTVESGGDAVYEMQDSSPIELPAQNNLSFGSLTALPQPSPAGSWPSPISQNTPESESGASSVSPTSRRRPSLRSSQGLSINAVMGGRTSMFSEYFDGANLGHGRHGSEVSEQSGSSEGREGARRIPGSDTIQEKD